MLSFSFCVDLYLQMLKRCFGLCKALLKRERECLLSPTLLFCGLNKASNKNHLDIIIIIKFVFQTKLCLAIVM